MAKKTLITAAILFLPSGCAMLDRPPRPPTGASVTVEEEEAWRNAAVEEDAAALDALPDLWAAALADALRAGFHRRIADEGALLAPAAGLPRAAPPPGAYLCRVLRLGARLPGMRPWNESAEGFCFVGAEHDRLSLTIDAGSRRIGGYLWEEKDNRRLIFLGTTSPRGTPLGGYGDDRGRDASGLFEQIGPFRYRLTLPWRGDNRLAIIELTPAPEQ